MSKKQSIRKRSSQWNAVKIKSIADYYDRQSEEDGAKEIDTAPPAGFTLIEVPSELLPQIRKMISKHRKSA
jgi:hypothetical protein